MTEDEKKELRALNETDSEAFLMLRNQMIPFRELMGIL